MVDFTNMFGGRGWICPMCGKSLAPWVPECDCKPMPPVPEKTEKEIPSEDNKEN